MPSSRVHNELDRLFFGRSYPMVHEEIDGAGVGMGVFHRILGHSPFDALYSEFPPSAVLHHVSDIVLTPLMPLFEPDVCLSVLKS